MAKAAIPRRLMFMLLIAVLFAAGAFLSREAESQKKAVTAPPGHSTESPVKKNTKPDRPDVVLWEKWRGKPMPEILAALAPGETVAQILVTHTHNDHSPLSRPLAEASGAPIFGFGDTRAGRSARMQALDAAWLGGGESADEAFQPDEHLSDGSDFEAGGQPIRALHTPGHYGNHLCYQWGEVLFTGDHLMGWAPSLVSPPDGDLTDFMASLDRIETLGARRAYPGHGAPLADAAARAGELRAHRRLREAAILAAIRDGAATLDAITARVYAEVPRALWPAARRNVLAHAIDLDARGLVAMLPEGGTGLRLEPG